MTDPPQTLLPQVQTRTWTPTRALPPWVPECVPLHELRLVQLRPLPGRVWKPKLPVPARAQLQARLRALGWPWVRALVAAWQQESHSGHPTPRVKLAWAVAATGAPALVAAASSWGSQTIRPTPSELRALVVASSAASALMQAPRTASTWAPQPWSAAWMQAWRWRRHGRRQVVSTAALARA